MRQGRPLRRPFALQGSECSCIPVDSPEISEPCYTTLSSSCSDGLISCLRNPLRLLDFGLELGGFKSCAAVLIAFSNAMPITQTFSA